MTKHIVEDQKSTKMWNWKHYRKNIRAKRKITCTYFRGDLTSNFTIFRSLEVIEKQGNCLPDINKTILHSIPAGVNK